jgi:hypothetical protein
MSRGMGRVERRVLDILVASDAIAPSKVLWWVAGGTKASPALSASVHRALASLARKGLAVRIDGKGWMHAEKWRREEAARQETDKREAEAAARREEAEREQRNRVHLPPPPGRLAKVLAMLGAEHDGEVLAAARHAERMRRDLGVTWEELIVMPRRPQQPHGSCPPPAQSGPFDIKTPALREATDAVRVAIDALKNKRISATESNAIVRAANAVTKAVGRRDRAAIASALADLRRSRRDAGL